MSIRKFEYIYQKITRIRVTPRLAMISATCVFLVVSKRILCILYHGLVVLLATIRWQTPVERRWGTGRWAVGLIVCQIG